MTRHEDLNDLHVDIHRTPRKRRTRARTASILICSSAAIFVIAFCIANRNEEIYYPDGTQKNATNVCYRKKEKLTFSVLLANALGLFGVVLSTLVNRLSLIVEECFHIRARYEGYPLRMIKACFSGILWGPVLVLLGSTVVIVIIIVSLPDNASTFKLSYLIYIASGIGVGPLIMQLLNLDTASEVNISNILEKEGTHVVEGLAWSYYLNYLKEAVPKFKNGMHDSPIKLSLDKLMLLIPLDCHIVDDLNQIDNHVEKLTDSNDSFHFTVYRLKVDKYCELPDENVAIEYVKDPLKTLAYMSLQPIKPVRRTTLHEEVKLLYKTLSAILADPVNKDIQGTCIIVPIPAVNLDWLKNGGLVKCIKRAVDHSDYDSLAKSGDALIDTAV